MPRGPRTPSGPYRPLVSPPKPSASASHPPLHPLIEAAGRGELPPWARVTRARREHMERVARLLRKWARALDLPEHEVVRWRAAGILHDALKNARPAVLRRTLVPELGHLPDALLHGPAVARKLREEGVEDEDFLLAVAFHTLGHPELRGLGRALVVADYIEPGRKDRKKWKKARRSRMPQEFPLVVREVVRARMQGTLARNRRLHDETVDLWNVLVEEAPFQEGMEGAREMARR